MPKPLKSTDNIETINKWLEEKELVRHRLDRIEDVLLAYKD